MVQEYVARTEVSSNVRERVWLMNEYHDNEWLEIIPIDDTVQTVPGRQRVWIVYRLRYGNSMLSGSCVHISSTVEAVVRTFEQALEWASKLHDEQDYDITIQEWELDADKPPEWIS